MEMLSNFSLILGGNMWHSIISWFASWITNYGWAIIVFTIALKLIMSPLDVYQRITSKKQQKFMNVMQPELQAIQQKYGNDKNRLNQETAKVYKKYNFNMGGMCLSMLLTLGLSMVIFITLFSSLRSFGDKKLYESYDQLNSAYVEVVGDKSIKDLSENDIVNLNERIAIEYKDLEKQNSWLWVKNVWKKDSKESQFIDFETYAEKKGVTGEAKDELYLRYNFITTRIDGDQTSPNGYYILIILSVAISFVTQWLSQKLTMPKGQKLNSMNKIMMGIIPLTMLIFAFTSNVVFTLYIIVNSIMTAIISTILALTMKSKKGKDEDIVLPKKNVEVVEYSRNYKK